MAGSIWDTYPYHQHKLQNIGWEPIGLLNAKNELRLRSDKCKHTGGVNGVPCISCQTIEQSHRFKNFVERATLESTPDGLNYDYMSPSQMKKLLVKISKKLHDAQWQVHTLGNTLAAIPTDQSNAD